jgi:hypothetical protein
MTAYTPSEIRNLRVRLQETWSRISEDYQRPNQVLGQKRSIGCVALEITQRCNLDCSICYLSENSESTPDIPLDTIWRRLDRIADSYGVGTNVQITGGDPTMRDHDELVEIVRRAASMKLVPALFTNGVHATRELLERLSEVGLVDVAFHVDLTEKRKGYSREVQLNEVRQEYVERARGLGLNVIFNQTVFARNFREVPDLVRFYTQNSDVVGMASFQLQADTGRGLTRKRKATIDLDTVGQQIEAGLGTSLSWDSVLFGHPSCHRIGYAAVFDKGAHVADLFDDKAVVAELLEVFDDVYLERNKPKRALITAITEAARRGYLRRGATYWIRRIRENWRPLVKARGRVRKVSFFMQNFQDAFHLDHERVDNCSFHCMTDDGGVSMCVHNAYRDHYLQGGIGYPTAYQGLRESEGYYPCHPGRPALDTVAATT